MQLATFEVERAVKGQVGESVTGRTLAAEAIAGVPRFRPGDEVVLFLYGESALGLTSPVALGYGRFRIFEDKAGRRLAINDFGNASLLQGLSDGARLRVGAGPRELTPHGLLDLAVALGGAR